MPAAIPIAIAMMAGGTALDVYGKVKAGNAARKAGDEAGQLEDYNAQVAEGQAQDAELRGQTDAQRQGQETRRVIGSQRAGFAGANVDVSVGSAVDVQADAAFLGELDVQTIEENARREALGFRQEGERAKRRGRYARMTGQAAQTASRFGAAGSILSGAAQGTSLLAQRYGWGSKAATTPSYGQFGGINSAGRY
jgi:hypothetical protein